MVFGVLLAHWSCRYKVDYSPWAKCSLQRFNCSRRHFGAKKPIKISHLSKSSQPPGAVTWNTQIPAMEAGMHPQSRVRCGFTRISNGSNERECISSIAGPIKMPSCISVRKKSLKTTLFIWIWKNNSVLNVNIFKSGVKKFHTIST